ncbi:MAG: hypothetical protein AB1806_04935 [Acidobacteriota bacterium]
MSVWRGVVVLALGSTILTAGCGGSRNQPPAAAPSASLQRSRVALGGAFAVTYRFTVAPTAHFDRDYHVLVHFLDPNEELLWTEDHVPPVATSAWKPGQTIEYAKTHFVPIYPYVGEAVMTLGLYDPASGERLPLAGDDTGQKEYVVSRLQLLPQTESILIVFKEGWHPAERAPDNPAAEWQWSKKDATWSFRNPRRNATFYLHYSGEPSMFDMAQTVTLYLQDQLVDSFTVDSPTETVRTLEFKAGQFGSDEMVQLRLSVDRTFVPARQAPGSGDLRELGLRVFHAVLEPL